MNNETNKSVFELISAVHTTGYERQVFQYFCNWILEKLDNTELENIKLRSSLGLIKDFNNEKWHIKLIDNLTSID